MSILRLGTVRMCHRFGGPDRVVSCLQNGQAIFIEWPMSGLIRIVVKTGKLWDGRKGPWTMHPEDLRRVTGGVEPYDIRLPMRRHPGIARPAITQERNPPMRAPGTQGGKSSV